MRVLPLLLIIFLIDCSGYSTPVVNDHDQDSKKTIYLVGHGWHAGIVLRHSDISDKLWPEINDFTDAEYLEIGWGDMDYYQIPDPHVGIIIKAALLPSSSVLHIVGFNDPVADYFPHSEVIELQLSDSGFVKMIQRIAATHSRDEKGNPIILGPGLYGDSLFYCSIETYHIFKTCNIWTAKTLRTAGLPVKPAIRVEGLMSQAGKLEKVVQSKQLTPDQ